MNNIVGFILFTHQCHFPFAFQGIPGNGSFDNIDDVISTVTSVIFISSVGHAAVNFGQYENYAFHPNYPGKLIGDWPTDKVSKYAGLGYINYNAVVVVIVPVVVVVVVVFVAVVVFLGSMILLSELLLNLCINCSKLCVTKTNGRNTSLIPTVHECSSMIS